MSVVGKKNLATPSEVSKTPSVAITSKQDIAPRSILERVQAFVELKFPVTVKELKHFKDEKQAADLEKE